VKVNLDTDKSATRWKDGIIIKMAITPNTKQKCLNQNANHKSMAYYCDECLEEVRKEEREKVLKELEKKNEN